MFLIAAILFITSSTAKMADIHSDNEADSKIIKVSVILDTPSSSFASPEKIYKTVDSSLSKIFQNNSKYDIQSLGDTDAYVQLYREDKNRAATVDNGIITSSGERDLSLTREDLPELCSHFESDYMIYIRVANSTPTLTGSVFSAGQKVNVTLDFRIWSVAKNDFVYLKRYVTTGSSSSFYIGMGSSVRAINKALKKGLSEIEKDAANILAVMP